MKSRIFIACALALCVVRTSAVELSLGPTIGYRGSINAANPGTGFVSGFALADRPDLGLSSRFLFDENIGIGFMVELEMSGYSYVSKLFDLNARDDSKTYMTRHRYTTFAPSVYIGGFQVGVGLMYSTGEETKSLDKKNTYFPGTQSTLAYELRVGGMIPVYKSDLGDLNLVVRASYMLDPHYSSSVYVHPDRTLPDGKEAVRSNPQSASFSIGVNYMFRLVKI